MTNPIPTPKEIEPSPYQQKIFDWVKDAVGSAIIIAVAGSGKSTTLRLLMRFLFGEVAFLAFNRAIADENQTKLPTGLPCRVKNGTFHSFGIRMWWKVAKKSQLHGEKLGYMKHTRIADELSIPFMHRTFVKKATSLAKQAGFAPKVLDPMKSRKDRPVYMLPFEGATHFGNREAWLKLVDHFDLRELYMIDGEEPPDIEDLVAQGINWTVHALKRGIEIATEVIDYDDMIYMPLVKRLQFWKYDAVLVDEAQDTNVIRRIFAKHLLKPEGRGIFVGDPKQAIYGFTGADSESLNNIKKEFNCVELPLTVCYRCSQKVVERARTWVKYIEPAPNAVEGDWRTIEREDIMKEGLTANDAVLCRNTAPLVELALQLLTQDIPCHIEGRDIGEDLIDTLKRFSTKKLDVLIRKLMEMKETQVPKLIAKGKELSAQKIEDTVDALVALIGTLPKGATVYDLEMKITKMFYSTVNEAGEPIAEPNPTLTLSTIHKSKGREWHRVFWYGNNVFQPSSYAKKAWQYEAEENLMYVAATRAMHTLIEVRLKPRIRRIK